MKTDVLIVGGGITGCALAYFLAGAGAKVVVVERFDLNTQASGSNAGSIHAQLGHDIFADGREAEVALAAPIVPILMAGIEFWKRLEKELAEDFELEIIGGLLVTDKPEQMLTITRKVAFERSIGLDIDVVDRADIRRIAPYISEKMVGGAFCPIEGEANALVVTPALARAATRLGATIKTSTNITAITRSAAGFTAETTSGPIVAQQVVNCAGAGGGEFSRLLGVDLPIFGEPIQVSVTEPAAPLVHHLVYYAGGRLTLKQTKRGALLIGGGWPSRYNAAGNLEIRSDSMRENLRICRHVVPKSGSIRVIRTWPAVVNDTKDALPILGEVPGVPGYFVASFPRMGFTGGPISASVVANMILGKPQNIDVSAFLPNRFL